MIVQVKIAPESRWCEPILEKAANLGWPGKAVEIDTKTMKHDPQARCGGAVWKVVTANGKKQIGTWWICEHILEMD